MTMSLPEAEKILEERNRVFMEADIEGYMNFWADDGVIEIDGVVITGSANIRQTIETAWSASDVLHFETRAFSVNGNTLLNEFAIVWSNKTTGEITVQTGMGVIDTDESGKWICLRDYFDASNNTFLDSSTSARESAYESESVSRYVTRDT